MYIVSNETRIHLFHIHTEQGNERVKPPTPYPLFSSDYFLSNQT